MIARIRKAFDILKTPLFRASRPNSKGYKCGYQPWKQHHYKAVDALRAATTKRGRTFKNIGTVGKLIIIKENTKKQLVGTMSLFDISIASCRLTSLKMYLLSNKADTSENSDHRRSSTSIAKRNAYDMYSTDSKEAIE